jgi:hypothetical protein
MGAVWLFLCALAIMKTGAKELAPALEGSAFTDGVASTLGFGWLGALLVMSGSPIATSALALLDGGAVDPSGAFAMLTGSRLGAAFVVFSVSVLYVLRGRGERSGSRAAVSIGLFSVILTALVYLPGMAIGLPLLNSGALASITPTAPVEVVDAIDLLTAPALDLATALLPVSLLFFAGLVVLIAALRLFDRAIPESDAAGLEEHSDWRSRKWVMFGIGSLVALVTMSVSVALTVLVPLVAKGYLRRRHALPYIMGANVTTLGDTLLTAMILDNADASAVVIAELIGVGAVTILLLAFAYRPLTELTVRATDAMMTKGRLAGFVAALFCVPVALVYAF